MPTTVEIASMPRRLAVCAVLCLPLGLAACAQPITTSVQEAQLAYGIAKGMAQQAVKGDPALQPAAAAIEVKADLLAAAVAADTAPTLASLAEDLLVATAQGVHVLPNGAPASAAASVALP